MTNIQKRNDTAKGSDRSTTDSIQKLVVAIQSLRASGSLKQIDETIDTAFYSLFAKNSLTHSQRDSVVCTLMDVRNILEIIFTNGANVEDKILDCYLNTEGVENLKTLYLAFLAGELSAGLQTRLNIYLQFESLKDILIAYSELDGLRSERLSSKLKKSA